MSQYIHHPYWDGAGRLTVIITVGDVTVMVRLNEEEARNIVAWLEQNAGTESGNGKIVAWWAYEALKHPPPLTLCRDDCFCVHLQHEVGEELLSLLKDKLQGGTSWPTSDE